MVVSREVRFTTVPEGARATRKAGVEVRLCLLADWAAGGMESELSLTPLFLVIEDCEKTCTVCPFS
jgi:hypothetical protein